MQRAVEAVESSKLPDGMVTITHADALKVDWAATGATVLFIYLTPTGITRARDKLEAIRAAGVRIIASVFKVNGVVWDALHAMEQAPDSHGHRLKTGNLQPKRRYAA